MFRSVAVSLCASVLATIAVGQNFAQRSLTIRAGVLLVDSQRTPLVGGVPSNYTPHVWFNLDSNRLMKPAGWNIVNPRSRSQLTNQMYSRWVTLVGMAGVPATGSAITKRHARYWEVPLSSVG